MRLEPGSQPYDSVYREFDSALMRRIRSEAYGEDQQRSLATVVALCRRPGLAHLMYLAELRG